MAELASRDDHDPLAAVLGLGNHAVRVGAAIGIAFALLTHTAASAEAMTSLYDMGRVLTWNRTVLHEFFWTMYDVDLQKDKPTPKEEPPPPPPEPEAPPPPVKAAPKPKEDPYDAPPPPAKAAEVLTRKENPDEPVDLTGEKFVTGNGTDLGGLQAGNGTGPQTWDPHAKVGGKVGGTGTGAPPPPPPPPAGPDLSRAAGLVGGSSWNCPFPPEADAEQIDQAVATILVVVSPDGTPKSVQIASDPGHGFGRAARICALGRRFTPALDHSGMPITSTTAPITVRFTR
jgi:periplasmic protein TonB